MDTDSAQLFVQKMREDKGIMNVVPIVSFPFNISLEVQGITSVIKKESKKRA